jgi:hypothetical protein
VTTTRTIRLFAIGERVRIISDANLPGQAGTIAGALVTISEPGRPPYLAYPVHLDRGFYSVDGNEYVSVMLVHHENLEPLED